MFDTQPETLLGRLLLSLKKSVGVPAEEQARWLMEHPAVAEIDLPCDVGGAAQELLGKLGL